MLTQNHRVMIILLRCTRGCSAKVWLEKSTSKARAAEAVTFMISSVTSLQAMINYNVLADKGIGIHPARW